MDQVLIYKGKALTTTEITSLYNSGNGLSYAAMAASGGPIIGGALIDAANSLTQGRLVA